MSSTPKTLKVKLGSFVFPVDYSKTREELDKKCGVESEDKHIVGLFEPDEQKIYIASDLKGPRQLRVLIHEVVEGFNEILELELDSNHAKIVSLENMLISFLVDNKALVKKVWKEFDGRTED